MKKTSKLTKANGFRCWLEQIVRRIFNPRKFWEDRAKKLPRSKWHVGRTDMYSYTDDDKGRCNYIHYVYSQKNQRIGFFGSPVSALRKAVIYAEKMNRLT